MAGTTTNYGFSLPLVDNPVDQDLWGGFSNGNWTSLDTLLKSANDAIVTKLVGYQWVVPGTTTYNATSADVNKIISSGSAGGTLTVNLPAPATVANMSIFLWRYNNNLTVTTPSGLIFRGTGTQSSLTLTANNQAIGLICDGTNWIVTTDTTQWRAKTTVYSTPGSTTWTRDALTLAAFVRGIGGGAGGGSVGGGGGSGRYAEAWYTAAELGSSQTVTIGAGGTAGNNGNTSSFGSLMTCPGGVTAGTSFTNINSIFQPGGVEASAASGTNILYHMGQRGGHGFQAANSFQLDVGGMGGSTTLGAGGAGMLGFSPNTSPTAGTGYGSGGGGARTTTPGAGANGAVIVVEFLGG